MSDAFVLGAVAYDPKVVTIWDGFVRWFAEQGFAFDYVLFTHYERLVEAQFAGAGDFLFRQRRIRGHLRRCRPL